jgi:ribokinase
MPGPRICVVGSANIDLTFRTARLPRPGESVCGHGFAQSFGGKGANQAVAAARLGGLVTMVGRVGCDGFGDAIRANFQQEGIDTTHLRTDPERPTGVAGIFVDDDACNCLVGAPGANLGMTPEDVEAAADALRGAAVVMAPLEVPAEAILAAFRFAKSAGVRRILNPSPAWEFPEELWRLTDVCVPNETEAETFTGRPIRDLADAATAGWELLRRGPAAVVVTLGSLGAMVVTAERAEHVPGVSVAAVDTTGAGDAFVGGLAVFLAEGRPTRDAVAAANAVAALSVTKPGAQSGLPGRDQLERFLAGV